MYASHANEEIVQSLLAAMRCPSGAVTRLGYGSVIRRRFTPFGRMEFFARFNKTPKYKALSDDSSDFFKLQNDEQVSDNQQRPPPKVPSVKKSRFAATPKHKATPDDSPKAPESQPEPDNLSYKHGQRVSTRAPRLEKSRFAQTPKYTVEQSPGSRARR
ncbi:hypothetical protein BDV19DRAFT_70710 [Aspergillus venezuelensis]